MSDENRQDPKAMILAGPFSDLPQKTLDLIRAANAVSMDPAGNVVLHDTLATIATYAALNTEMEDPGWTDKMSLALKAQESAIRNKSLYSELMRVSDPNENLRDAEVEIKVVTANDEMIEHRRQLLGLEEDGD
tara:strand:- start:6957 stop:7355 length:399 start_codon:yes stop_codon:yes gene_type:complete